MAYSWQSFQQGATEDDMNRKLAKLLSTEFTMYNFVCMDFELDLFFQ